MDYEDDELDIAFDDAVASFFNKMLLNTVFKRLPKEFTYKEFVQSFSKTFKSLDLDDADLQKAFLMSIDLEIIEPTEENPEIYKFNGIAIHSDDWN